VIRILNEASQPIRFISALDQTVVYHRRYGFVGPDSLERREKMRLASGAFIPNTQEEFSFHLESSAGRVNVVALEGCASEALNDGTWRLKAGESYYFLEEVAPPNAVNSPIEVAQEQKESKRLLPFLIIILIGIVAALQFLLPNANVEETKEQIAEALPVLITEKPRIVEVVKPTVKVDTATRARRLVSQQLGFLKLLGTNNASKIAGGLPTEAAQRSPGAGKGGTEGSGGELLADMGRALNSATVGNSGVKGLGGIGTHGAGGGLGGYGDTAFAGSGGQALSALPMAQEARIESGLDRSQIQATIMRYLSQVRACYEEGLKRNQALIGQITMNFEVNGGGMLNYANVQRSSLGDRGVEDCVSTKMLTWKFPQPRGGVNVKVSYPFMLRPIRS
jgi:hypothetical protein